MLEGFAGCSCGTKAFYLRQPVTGPGDCLGISECLVHLLALPMHYNNSGDRIGLGIDARYIHALLYYSEECFISFSLL